MGLPRFAGVPLSSVLVFAACLPAFAAGRVELELVTAPLAPITAQQEWLRRLAEVGVGNVRIRAQGPLAEVGIVVRGTERSPVYVVTGVISSSSELVLSGARFRPGQAAQLVQWLDDLAKHGPPEQRPQTSAFGLTAEQFEKLYEALSLPVGFSTKDVTRRQAVEKIGGRLPLPLRIDPALVGAMRDDDLIAEDLAGVSCGTALAYVARPLGAGLVPRESAGGKVELAIVRAKPTMEAWPIGWELEKPPLKVLPGLFEFLDANVEGVPVKQVIDAVGGRLEVPVLLDYNALARHGIQPDKAIVNLPRRRTSYSSLLNRCLFQARLKSELRIDEADKPLLWITTLKPIY